MFKLKYNLLAAIQIFIGVLNYALLMKTFGVSAAADTYLMGVAVIASLQLLQMMFVEQFMYFYNDIKLVSKDGAHSFFNFSFTFALIVGIAAFLLSNIFIWLVLKVFAFGLDPARLLILSRVLRILFVSLIFYPVVYINVKFLNAEMKFSLPYVLNFLPNLLVVAAQAVLIVLSRQDILPLCYAYAGGVASAAIVGWLAIVRMGVGFRFSLRHEAAPSFIRNSVSMRLGHNIHNFLFTPVTNNFLALFPSGYASYFYYAQKLVSVVFSVTVGPAHNVFLSKVANLWSSRSIPDIVELIRRFLRMSLLWFVAAGLAVYMLFPAAMRWLPFSLVSQSDVEVIKNMFLLLAAWNFVIVFEMPFVGVGMAARNSYVFILSNSVFITIYFALCMAGRPYLGIYALPLAAIISQLINFSIYSNYASKVLGETVCSVLRGKNA